MDSSSRQGTGLSSLLRQSTEAEVAAQVQYIEAERVHLKEENIQLTAKVAQLEREFRHERDRLRLDLATVRGQVADAWTENGRLLEEIRSLKAAQIANEATVAAQIDSYRHEMEESLGRAFRLVQQEADRADCLRRQAAVVRHTDNSNSSSLLETALVRIASIEAAIRRLSCLCCVD